MAMRRVLPILLLFLLLSSPLGAQNSFDPFVRIGDITRLDGVRSNQLIGYGLVIGLEGSGDSSRSSSMLQSIANMLSSFGIEVGPSDIQVRNVAAAIVTAELPPFKRPGDRIDVIISSLGDARSLQGGVLLLTPLRAPNGDIYAVAQGPLSIGGFNVRTGRVDLTRNHPTSGRIPEGAIVERQVRLDMDLSNLEALNFILQEPDFSTASSIAKKINETYDIAMEEDVVQEDQEDQDNQDNQDENAQRVVLARALDAGMVQVRVPSEFQGRVVEFISEVQGLMVQPSVVARVVINERTGTVVMGHNVRISTVAVSHGNLTVMIEPRELLIPREEDNEADEPLFDLFRSAEVTVIEEPASLALIQGPTISDLVRALNAVGTTPRDLIAIIQAIKAQGALHAELVIM